MSVTTHLAVRGSRRRLSEISWPVRNDRARIAREKGHVRFHHVRRPLRSKVPPKQKAIEKNKSFFFWTTTNRGEKGESVTPFWRSSTRTTTPEIAPNSSLRTAAHRRFRTINEITSSGRQWSIKQDQVEEENIQRNKRKRTRSVSERERCRKRACDPADDVVDTDGSSRPSRELYPSTTPPDHHRIVVLYQSKVDKSFAEAFRILNNEESRSWNSPHTCLFASVWSGILEMIFDTKYSQMMTNKMRV